MPRPDTNHPSETPQGADDPVDTVVLDVDGTLVDTVYHHVSAWATAFDGVDVVVPLHRVHRAIGMGGDRLVREVAGGDVDQKYGDAVREHHDRIFDDMIAHVHPLPGAADLLDELRLRGLRIVIASSGLDDQTKRLLELVGGPDKADDAASSGEVERTKPAPDLVEAAVEKVGGTRAAMIGDAVWDVSAAKKAGHYVVGVLTGGFSESELREAGADAVYETLADLVGTLDDTPLRGRR
jgi:HAD superfamily hydrolase (TIGR01509 family)